MIDLRLADKVALVTGASGGIGAATARALAHQGAAVFSVYLGGPNDPKAAEMVAGVREQGGRLAAW